MEESLEPPALSSVKIPAILLAAMLCSIMLYQSLGMITCTPFADWCGALHRAIVSHYAPSPYQYRVLAPLLVNTIAPNASDDMLIPWYSVLNALCLIVTFPALYAGLRRWLAEWQSLFSVGLMTIGFAFAYPFWYLSPWSFIEIALVCLAMIYLDNNRIYALLVATATLNRETGLLLPLLYIAYYWTERQERTIRRRMLLYMAEWLLITAGLHLLLGQAPIFYDLPHNLQVNLTTLNLVLLFNAPLLLLSLTLTTRYHNLPMTQRRLLVVALLYLLACGVFGIWIEMPRMTLSVFPVLLPCLWVREPL